jgi:class 3 adenylate cyclase
MDDSQKRKSRLEIGHVLFIDIAGYSKLTTEKESEALPELTLRRLRLGDERRLVAHGFVTTVVGTGTFNFWQNAAKRGLFL